MLHLLELKEIWKAELECSTLVFLSSVNNDKTGWPLALEHLSLLSLVWQDHEQIIVPGPSLMKLCDSESARTGLGVYLNLGVYSRAENTLLHWNPDTVKPPCRGHPWDQEKCHANRSVPSSEVHGNIYKDYSNISQFQDQSLCHLNGGVCTIKVQVYIP